MDDNVKLRILPIQDWQKKIARHWNVENPKYISAFNNPFGMIRYWGEELFSKILFFPVELQLDGQPVAYSSIYNISSTHLRIRGIYVEAPFRGRGFAHIIVNKMLELWPRPWSTVIGYFRPESWDKFEKHSRFMPSVYIHERASAFTRKPLILAYKKFQPNESIAEGQAFIDKHIDQFGYLGRNNRLSSLSQSVESDGGRFWGYDGLCDPNIKRINGRNIFFVSLNNFIQAASTSRKSNCFLRFRNLSYDPVRQKKVGTDDWALEFDEAAVQEEPTWSGCFEQAIKTASTHLSQFEESFLIDGECNVLPDSLSSNGVPVNTSGKHYFHLSRLISDKSFKILKVYGSVDEDLFKVTSGNQL